MFPYLPIVLIASGVALLALGERKEENEQKPDQHGGRRANRRGDRQQHPHGAEHHREGGVNERPGMEPEKLGDRAGGQPRHNRGGEPDPSEGLCSAEPVNDDGPAPKTKATKPAKKKEVKQHDQSGGPGDVPGDDPPPDGGEHSQSGGDA